MKEFTPAIRTRVLVWRYSAGDPETANVNWTEKGKRGRENGWLAQAESRNGRVEAPMTNIHI